MLRNLREHPLYQVRDEDLTIDERIALSYKRAKLVLETHNLSIDDLLQCTPKFWGLHSDPVLPLDMSCYTVIAAHLTLAMGTIAKHAQGRDDLIKLLDRLRLLDIVGVYLLSERGHGTDAFNVETTATVNADGYILNTPNEEAAKWVPATTPFFNVAKVAVVFARLIRAGKNCGVRPFLVPICDTKEMCRGVSCIRLSPRSATTPFDFSMTMFDNVQLPRNALLGPDEPNYSDPLSGWWEEVSCIRVGTAAITGPLVQGLKHVAYIGGRYSLVRTVLGKGTKPVPIISFRTQQRPILQAVAAAMVLDNWFPRIAPFASDQSVHPSVRHALAVILKASAGRLIVRCMREVADRCGAQGTFEYNFIGRIEADTRGALIAEGEVLTLCIRLFNELLLGRYSIPPPKHTGNPLWIHATKVFEDGKHLLSSLPGGHRSEDANRLLSPWAEPAILALGYAHAYSAGVEANLPQPILSLFECLITRVRGATTAMDDELEDLAINTVMQDFPQFLSQLNIASYVTSPIVSEQTWRDYIRSRTVISGAAKPEDVVPLPVMARL